MTTYYLDTEAGSDVADGLSFANRKKTPASFTGLAAGDEIRVIASQESDLGNATWTDNTQFVVLATAVNQTIEACDSGWTAATNVVVTYPTTQPAAWVEGAGYMNLAPNGSLFTTGKMAYKAFGSPLDLSAYTMISFIGTSSAGSAAVGNIRIDLCSDATGDVPIVSLTNTDSFPSNRIGHLLDNGSALPSAVNSIAIYAVVDPGTNNFRFDNIIACKAKSSGLHLSHLTAIKKNDAVNKEVYQVRAIDGVNVYLGNKDGTPSSSSGRTWRGATETINTHAIVPLYQSADVVTTVNLFGNFSGTAASPIKVTGGWNRTDMSTQTGETWHCRNLSTGGYAYGLYGVSISGVHDWTFEKFGFIGYSTAPIKSINEFTYAVKLDLIGLTGCGEIFHCNTSGPFTVFDITFDHLTLQTGSALSPNYSNDLRGDEQYLKVRGRKVTMAGPGFAAICGVQSGSPVWSYEDYDLFDVVIDQIHNCAIGFGGICTMFSIRNCAFSLNTLNLSNSMMQEGCCWMDNCTPTLTASTIDRAVFISIDRNGVAGADSVTKSTVSWSKSSTVHSTSPFSHQIGSSGVITPMNTNSMPLVQVACKAGDATTVSAWVRFNGSPAGGRFYGLRARALPRAGVTEQVASGPNVNTTWNQISVTFTPTKDCVITVDGWTNGTVNIDDIEVSVA